MLQTDSGCRGPGTGGLLASHLHSWNLFGANALRAPLKPGVPLQSNRRQIIPVHESNRWDLRPTGLGSLSGTIITSILAG
jgi:hypothetical protein